MPTPTKKVIPSIATDRTFDTFINGRRVIVFPTDILGRKWLEFQLKKDGTKKRSHPHPRRLHWNKSHVKPARNMVTHVARAMKQTIQRKKKKKT